MRIGFLAGYKAAIPIFLKYTLPLYHLHIDQQTQEYSKVGKALDPKKTHYSSRQQRQLPCNSWCEKKIAEIPDAKLLFLSLAAQLDK